MTNFPKHLFTFLLCWAKSAAVAFNPENPHKK
jgi:hypothetical protein